jgi:2-C-methyl-D-erythritol 4-phosphate cytidylyltransferase/2-C-methyl-D-erythritol 2,4-cyclodiphosphate synthase
MIRIGTGYDSHRFQTGRPLWLAGVEIPAEQGLAGHSDADAVLHAVTDAVLGALGEADIGEHFPDSDPQWAGAASSQFLQHAVMLANQADLRVGNCDVTILAEAPRLAPHKGAMKEKLAELLQVDAARVAVKAKTNEGMGFVGHGEGIAVMAAVVLSDQETRP